MRMMNMTTSLVVASSLLAFGCSKKAEEGTQQKPTEGSAAVAPPPKVEAPKPMVGAELAARYQQCVAIINDGKFDDFHKECIDPSFKLHDNGDGSERTAPELIGWFKSMKEGMPDFKLQPQLILVSGRNIMAVELVSGTHTATMKSPMGDMPATNKKIGLLMFHKIAINDANKATEEWAYSDPATLMGQLGVAPKDAMPTRPAMEKGLEGAPIIAVAADNETEKKNLAMSKKAVEAVNSGKMADMLALLDPNATLSDQAAPKDLKGTKEIEGDLKMWFTSFKDSKINIDQVYAVGDYTVEIGKFTGTHDKDLGPIKKTGKTVSLDVAEVVQVKDGKAINLWRFHSGLQFAMQLGLMPPPGAPAPGGAPKAEEKK